MNRHMSNMIFIILILILVISVVVVVKLAPSIDLEFTDTNENIAGAAVKSDDGFSGSDSTKSSKSWDDLLNDVGKD